MGLPYWRSMGEERSPRHSMCRRGRFAGKGVFVALTLLWVILLIVVAVESSRCTVCEVNSDRCSSSIWQSSASDDTAFRVTFTVGDSGNYDISGCSWTAIQIFSYGTLLFFALSLFWCCYWCYTQRKLDQDGQESSLSAASADSFQSFTRDNPHYTGPLGDESSQTSSQFLRTPKPQDSIQ